MSHSISSLKRKVPAFFAQRPPPRQFHIRNRPLKASRLAPPHKTYVFEYKALTIRAAWEYSNSPVPMLVKLRPYAFRTFVKNHFFDEHEHDRLRQAKASQSSITIQGQTFDWS